MARKNSDNLFNHFFENFYSNFNYRKILVLYFITFLIIVIIQLSISVNLTTDYPYYEQQTYGLCINPYTTDTLYSKYPAFYFMFMGALGLLGIHSAVGIRLVYGIFNALNAVLMFYLYIYFKHRLEHKKYRRFKKTQGIALPTKNPYNGEESGDSKFNQVRSNGSKSNQAGSNGSRFNGARINLNIYSLERNVIFRALFFPIIFFFFPHNLLMLEGGDNDEVSLFFLILGVIFFLRNQMAISAVLIGIGTIFKIFPVFFFVAIAFYFLKNSGLNGLNRLRGLKDLIVYFIIMLITMIIISLPYLIMDFKAYLTGITIHASRMNTGFSYGALVPELYEVFYILSIPNLIEIKISYLFFIQIFIFSFVLLFYFVRTREFGIKEMFICYIAITSVFPYVAFQDHFMTIYRFLPFLIFVMNLRQIRKFNFDKNSDKQILFKLLAILSVTTIVYKIAEYILQFFTQAYSASFFFLIATVLFLYCSIKYFGFADKTEKILNISIIFCLFTILQTAYYSLSEGLTIQDRTTLFILRSLIYYPIFYIILYVKSKRFTKKN